MAVLAPALVIATPASATRVRSRFSRKAVWTALWLAMGAAAIYFLAPQANALVDSIEALRRVNPLWLAAGLAAVAARYAAAAVSLVAATGARLSFTPTLMVQLATSFVGRLTPEGIGWLVLNQRYLEKAGLPRASAAAALTLRIGAGAVTRLAIIAVVAFLLGRDAVANLTLPFPGPIILGALAAVGASLVAIGYAIRARAPRLVRSIRTGAAGIATTLRSPSRAGILFGGSAAVTISYVATLAFSLNAFGAQVPFLELFGIYLAGTAIAAASPTPGNLGALEVALVGGLAGTGLDAGTAMAAVLVFRLLTFWIPLLPGFLAFRYLQHGEYL